jgi:glycosyltransferase involved in cell wall biosynthesis
VSNLRLRIRRPSFFGVEPAPRPLPPGTDERDFSEVKGWLRDAGSLSNRLFHYHDVELVTSDLDHLSKPFPTALLLRLLSRGGCFLSDDRGRRERVGAVRLARYGWWFARDVARLPLLLERTHRRVRALGTAPSRDAARTLDLTRPPLYLRSDLMLDVRAGGSVGHVAGVVNNLAAFAAPPVFVTSAPIPTVRPDVETHVVPPGPDFCGYEEVPPLHYNEVIERRALQALAGRRAAFVYHRYGVYSYAGLALARRLGVPFVLEYNGSELWISRHWGHPLRFLRTAQAVEGTLLRSADLVVVVSRPIRDELLAQGIVAERILVNPNGVDPERYSPAVDGSAVRRRHGLRSPGGGLHRGFDAGTGPCSRTRSRLVNRPEWQDSSAADDRRRRHHAAGASLRETQPPISPLSPTPCRRTRPAHLAACDVLARPVQPGRHRSCPRRS